jgi:hypothetical protein
MFINMEIGTHNTKVPTMNQRSDVTRMANGAAMASKREKTATSAEYGKEK